MSDGERKVQKKTTKESEIEEFITHRSWRAHRMPWEATEVWGVNRGQGRVQVEWAAESGARVY